MPLSSSFYYISCDAAVDGVGKRVRASFGKRKLIGFVIGETDVLPSSVPRNTELKTIESFIDDERIFTEYQIALAKKIARFYLCEMGEVLSCMVPSAKRTSSSLSFGFEMPEFSSQTRPLSDEQKNATAAISSAIKNGNPQYFYIHGITGSGKTEVYLQAIQAALDAGKTAVYLVPEISLTQQASEELLHRFGDSVAVLHSGLTASEKLREWHRCIVGEAKVVIGARSAIFAPLENIGLIVIDEEHDGAYKSSSTPRYHARQVAMMIAQDVGCPLVMGSATPSVEAWYAIRQGIIKKLSLTKRLAGGAPPKITCVSVLGQSNSLSKELIAAMKATKAEGKQSIIFLNRRGFTRTYVCYSCGFQLLCKNCSVPMTYHKKENRMKCHYCGWQTLPPQRCPECGSLEAGYAGFGTEFIEDEIKRFLPDCTLSRIDTDTTAKRGSVQKVLKQFREKNIDILLGTQMVAKGLNFPNVNLVGIVLADTGLQMPDFRASERTFALMTQVAGRAGRFVADGHVIIQTLRPTHPAIIAAKDKRLEDFYAYEIEQRRLLEYPPFTRLVRIVFRSKLKQHAEEAAIQWAAALKTEIPKSAELLGPTECMISLIAGNNREQILLKNKTLRPLQAAARTVMQNIKTAYDVYVEIDVDPINLL